MKNLIEKIASYERATQSLIDKTYEYEGFIKGNIPSEFWGKFGLKKFGHSQNSAYHISVNGKLIPDTVQKIDSSFYWGNDFNYHYSFVNPKELIEWCKDLPSLIIEATECIDTLTKDADNICAQISVPK